MKLQTLGSICLGLAMSLAAYTAQAQEPVNVRISFDQSEQSPAWQQAMKVLGDELESGSNGRFKVTHYTGEVLHKISDGFRAVATGITDIASAYPVYSANSFHLFHAPGLPLALPQTNVAAARVVDELYPTYFKDEYERMGVLVAFNAVTPGYDILTTKPVRSVEDLKGLKIRSAGAIITQILERLGATPVTMTISDTYTAFQQGVVDGIALSTADMVAYRLHEVGRYNYRIGIVRVPIPFAVNKDFYTSLPDDLRLVFDKAAANAGYNYSNMYTPLTERALEEMKKQGIEIVEASGDDLTKVEEMAAPLWEDFVSANSGRPGPSAADLVSDLRSLSEKYKDATAEEIQELKDIQPVAGLR